MAPLCYRRYLGALIFTAVVIFTFSQNAQARDDWEYWGEATFKYALTDNLAFKITPKMQVRDDFSNPYYWESAHGLAYKLNKYFDLGAYHLFAEEDRADTNKTESRLRLESNVHAYVKGLKLSDRVRYEYRTFNIGGSKDRVRNRVMVTFKPVTVMNQEITPYISNEFFYDLKVDSYNQNRAVVGFSKKLSKKIKAGLYYMVKSSKSAGHWDEASVVGTKLDINFN